VRPGSEEYLDSEKYQIRQRDWNAPGSLAPLVAQLNRIRRENPALQQLENLEFLHSDDERVLCYRKWAPGNQLIVTVNLDPHGPRETSFELPRDALGLAADEPLAVEDLLDGARYRFETRRGWVRLEPGAGRVAHVLRAAAPGAGA
jgi:starch synthase (maltosyl-transferring)